MFEDALVMGRSAGSRKSLIVLGSLGVQVCLVIGLVGVPLLWPAVLPVVSAAPKTIVLVKRAELKPEPRHEVVRVTNDAAARAPSPIAQAATVTTNMRPGSIARGPAVGVGEGTPTVATFGLGMGSGPLVGIGPGGGGPGGSAVVVAARKVGPVRVSSGVVAGLLVAPITPIYPQLAKATHTSGTVVLRATIDTAGRIVGVQVVSGPEMLRRSALEAVAVARYKPYLLNGEATEVETTISVVFMMG